MHDAAELFRQRIALLRVFQQRHGLDGLLLSRVDNFAMATGGRRNFVNLFSEAGANSLLVLKDGRVFCIANRIEAPRQEAEELAGLGVETVRFDWFSGSAVEAAERIIRGKLASDDGSFGRNVHKELAALRALLAPAEVEKYRFLGALAADAMVSVLGEVRAGDSEADIAARLTAAAAARQIQAPVVLIAADGRVARFRHPLPVVPGLLEKEQRECRVRDYVMLVGGFMREGLSVSITRFAQVGNPPEALREAQQAIAGVDAAFQSATVPGRTLGEVFELGCAAYGAAGFDPLEWHNHHQGGVTGYGARVMKGAPGERFPVLDTRWAEAAGALLGEPLELSAAFAWNPSAPGVKSEDTFVVHSNGAQEIVTRTPSLPPISVGFEGIERSDWFVH